MEKMISNNYMKNQHSYSIPNTTTLKLSKKEIRRLQREAKIEIEKQIASERASEIKKARKSTNKILSERYLNDAKRLGYKWQDLLRKATRDKVIDKVIKFRDTETKKQAIRDAKLKKKTDKIKRAHEKIMKTEPKTETKQTADVLIFQRYEAEKDIPEGRKIAFRDHNGKPYIMRFRRYFIIDKINDRDANRYITKRAYDYQDDFDRVVEFLDTSEDFQIFNKDYVNCVIINSLTNIDDTTEANDLLDEDLFMSKEEYGVFSRYININQNKGVKNVEDNSCYVKMIVKRF